MNRTLIGVTFLAGLCGQVNAVPVPECTVKAKIFQNPSAMAGAAETCMQRYFEGLEADADACRAEASEATLPAASYAACQATLIFDLREQIGGCRDEAQNLLEQNDELTSLVKDGAAAGCEKLVAQAASICRENAGKFDGLAESTAMTACEQAGL